MSRVLFRSSAARPLGRAMAPVSRGSSPATCAIDRSRHRAAVVAEGACQPVAPGNSNGTPIRGDAASRASAATPRAASAPRSTIRTGTAEPRMASKAGLSRHHANHPARSRLLHTALRRLPGSALLLSPGRSRWPLHRGRRRLTPVPRDSASHRRGRAARGAHRPAPRALPLRAPRPPRGLRRPRQSLRRLPT